jgi:hypothetical protein
MWQLLIRWLRSDPLKRIRWLGVVLGAIVPLPAILQALELMGVRIRARRRFWLTVASCFVAMCLLLGILLMSHRPIGWEATP